MVTLASLTVEKFGTDKIAIKLDDLNDRIKRFKNLVEVDIKQIDKF